MATRPENENQRQQIILLVGLLVVLLAVVWFFLLRGGGEDEDLGAPTPAPVVTPDLEPTPLPSPTRRGGQVETFDVFAARDPFEPLIDPDGATGTAPATGDGTTDDGTGTDDGAGPGDGNGTGPGGGGNGNGNGSSGNGSQQVEGHTVKLVDVFKQNGKDRVRVQVDGTVYTVDVGETFAENFKLLSVSGRCASLLFGDDQFTICEGEQILK